MSKYPYLTATYSLGFTISLLLLIQSVLSLGGVSTNEEISPSVSIAFGGWSLLGIVSTSVVLILGFILYRLYEGLALLGKHPNRLAFIFFVSLTSLLQTGNSPIGSALLAIVILSVALLSIHYQVWYKPTTYLAIGFVTGLLTLQSPIYATLLLLWGIIGYQLKNISFRGTIAMLIGFVIPTLIAIPLMLWCYPVSSLSSMAEQWLQSAYVQFELPSIREVSFLALSLLPFFSFKVGQYTENIRQRAIGGSLLTLGIAGSILSLLFPTSPMDGLVVISVSVLSARALSLLQGRSYITALLLHFIILVILAFLTH